MKAPGFRYECPATLEAALALLARDDDAEVAPLAGGQSLMPMMNFRMARPEVLVDLNRIAGLDEIRLADGWLEIGAMTRYRTLATAPQLAEAAPLIARALPYIAHPAIRNRGTLGGSVALADPAAEMPAVLLATGGRIVLRSAEAQREVAAADFFLGIYETARRPDELVTAIRVPVAKPGQRFGFHEIARRHGDYAMAGCCIRTGPDFADPRVALFGVSDRAVRAPGAEAALSGSDGGRAAADAAVAALVELVFEGDQNAGPETKQHLAGVALRRALAEVTA